MVPAGYDMEVLDPAAPEFTKAMREAEYLIGFPRAGMGPGLLPERAQAQAAPARQRGLRPTRRPRGEKPLFVIPEMLG